MALIAIGDFDAEAVVGMVRDAFAELPAEPGPRERTDWPVPAHADTLYALADDPELRGTSVGLTIKRPPLEGEETFAGYRRDLVRSMALGMVNDRLAEVARSDDPPFLGASVRSHPIGRTVELTSMSARVPEGGEARGLEALVVEIRRAAEHGFLASEVERTRREMLAGIEASWAERDKTPSGAFASEYTRHFLHDEPIPGIDVERRIFRDELPGIDAAECHGALLGLLDGHGVVVEATRPTRDDVAGEDELRAALRAAAAVPVAPWVDEGAGGDLLASPGPPGRVVERREIPSVGVTELALSNGVRVFVKPTDFQDDEVLIRGSAPGGTSLAADEDLVSAEMAGHLLAESGWGGRTAIELGKLLAGKMVSVRPYHAGRTHGVSGSSTVADLPTALELAVLVMTEPNRDAAAGERFRERLRSRLVNRDADPSARYADRVTALFTGDHPRARPLTLERLDELDPEAAVAFHESAFANAADFTFFLVGNLDVDALVPELERTLGSLPSTGAASSDWIDRGVRFPGEAAEEVVRAGREPRAHTTLAFPSYSGEDPREWHRLRTAASILGRRLRETLREDLGGTYGVSVRYARRALGDDAGRIEIRFGADPGEIDALVAEAIRVVEDLRADGPTAEEIAKEKEIQTRELETQWETNGFWIGALSSLWERGRPFDEMEGRQTRIDELDAESLGRVFRESFRPDSVTRVTWLPEEVAAGE
jgi:zinc protease